MIATPINDHECLTALSRLALEHAHSEDVQRFAARYPSTRQLQLAIRAMPQRDDRGHPTDGPRIACGAVSQRVRELPGDPNCFERSALYLAGAEHIDPNATRQLMTINTPFGMHTYPVEDGRAVVLDPIVPRNALESGLHAIRNANGWTPETLLGWVLHVADEHVHQVRNGRARLRSAEAGFSALLDRRTPNQRNVDDMGLAFALAHQGARAWTGAGVDPVALGVLATERLLAQHRNFSVRIGNRRIRPDWDRMGRIGKSTARVAGRVGARLLPVATRAYLASHGIPPQLLDEIEREYAKEGLTLGPLASKPQPLGTLESLALQRATGKPASAIEFAASGRTQPFGG